MSAMQIAADDFAKQTAQALANKISKKIFPSVCHLDLFVTEDCNCRCPYCFVEGKRHQAMSRDVARQSLKFLVEYSKGYRTPGILFFGGEPLLEFDLIRFIVEETESWEKKTNKKFVFSVTTNGTLLTKEILSYFKEKKIKFLLSMDGNKETHDKYRKLADGTPTFDMLVERLRWFKSYQPWMGVRLTIAPGTSDRLQTDVEFLYSKGINQFIIGPVTGVKWSEKQLIEYERGLFNVAEMYLAKIRTREPFRMTLFESNLDKDEDYKDKWGCGAGRGRISVTAAGELQGCAKIQGAFDMEGFWPIGNVYDGFSDLKNRMFMCAKMVDRRKKCVKCDIRDKCGGGCPAVNVVETGDVFIPSRWNCEFVRITLRLKEHVRRRREELKIA